MRGREGVRGGGRPRGAAAVFRDPLLPVIEERLGSPHGLVQPSDELNRERVLGSRAQGPAELAVLDGEPDALTLHRHRPSEFFFLTDVAKFEQLDKQEIEQVRFRQVANRG